VFCEKCALGNYANDSNCFKCGTSTNGIFKDATKLIQTLREAAAETKDEVKTDKT
jgi:hypothetical protein